MFCRSKKFEEKDIVKYTKLRTLRGLIWEKVLVLRPINAFKPSEMKYLYHILAALTGGLFVFSGAVKLNDPVGTALKMEEYFQVFAADFNPLFRELVPYSLPFAIFICVVEVVLGLALLSNFKKYFTLSSLLALVIFFAFLTYYSAEYNKVTDCGCFGDAIKLSPWESFYKDIILMGALLLLLVISFFLKKDKKKKVSAIPSYVVLGGTIFSLIAAYYVLAHEPFIDFRPFKVGNDIKAMRTPLKKPIYEYIMTDSTGKELVFKDYPQDSTLKYKSYRLANPEDSLLFLPKIMDYNFTHPERGDYTEESLKGNKMLILVQNVGKTNRDAYAEIAKLAGEAKNVEFAVITADSEDKVKELLKSTGLNLPFYFGDEKLIKTVMRCNPGLFLLKDGVVAGKWHYNDTPNAEKLGIILNK
jgi:uncharacterized membrane protein YphA (DoxX/SURF4 family)